MADLLSLPAELLLHIFDALYSHRPRIMGPRAPHTAFTNPESDCDYRAAYQALAALARTCEFLRPIATEALYKRCISPFHRLPAAFTGQIVPNRTARRDTRYIEILRDDKDRDRRRPAYTSEARHQVQTDVAQQSGRWRQHAQEETKHEFAQTVLALLVATSPNLETFVMKCTHRDLREETQETPPVWLLPIIEAMQEIPMGIMPHTRYEKLHTMDLNMQRTYSLALAYIFALPSLRKLRLHNISCLDEDERPVHWPLPPKCSGVDTLLLYNVSTPNDFIRCMVASCKALRRFHYGPEFGFEDTDPDYLDRVVSALQQQQASLKILTLQDQAEYDKAVPQDPREPLDGFQWFHALRSFSVPFDLLMGKPLNPFTGQEEWQYPRMRDVLPPQIEHLKLDITKSMVSRGHEDAYTAVLTSALPLDLANSCLKEIELEYGESGCRKSLPCNFWDIKHVYMERGIRLDYSIGSVWGWEDDDVEDISHGAIIDHIASNLVKFGPKGVEIAHHIEDLEDLQDDLVPALLRKLNLSEDWVKSEEGRKFMFAS